MKNLVKTNCIDNYKHLVVVVVMMLALKLTFFLGENFFSIVIDLRKHQLLLSFLLMHAQASLVNWKKNWFQCQDNIGQCARVR